MLNQEVAKINNESNKEEVLFINKNILFLIFVNM